LGLDACQTWLHLVTLVEIRDRGHVRVMVAHSNKKTDVANYRKIWTRLMVLLYILVAVGCAKSTILPDFDPMRAEVEKLYLNYHALKIVNSDLHAAARRHIEESGDQLAEIQSAARFMDQANLIAYYQWELLSITEYIRDGARSDFFTLRVKDLTDAHQKSKDLILAIKVYDAFIRDPQALALIEKGIGIIQQDMAIYNALVTLLIPLSNRTQPSSGQISESI
jgi:hypothetical protein